MAFKVKEKRPGQRACDEKDAKGDICAGHLKRWYYGDPRRLTSAPGEEDAIKQFGGGAEIYRCERCRTLYRPAPGDCSTAGQKYELHPVNLIGEFSGKK